MCVGGRLDVVFLVPASTDRINLASPLRALLTSAAGSLHTIGARDSQVYISLKTRHRDIEGRYSTAHIIYWHSLL